jgi:hypothetical protein
VMSHQHHGTRASIEKLGWRGWLLVAVIVLATGTVGILFLEAHGCYCPSPNRVQPPASHVSGAP